ncbi:MAG: hypothetical protein LKK12_06080 [Bacteroidales bacterium]|nr:hypothetical protein [Bacteroidales bacterium]
MAGIVLICRSHNFRLFLPSCFRQSPPNAARRTVRFKVSTFIHYTGFWTWPITSPIKQIGSLSSYSNSQSAVNKDGVFLPQWVLQQRCPALALRTKETLQCSYIEASLSGGVSN